jgi:hypothetical protein
MHDGGEAVLAVVLIVLLLMIGDDLSAGGECLPRGLLPWFDLTRCDRNEDRCKPLMLRATRFKGRRGGLA